MGVFWSNCRRKVVLTEGKMGVTRFFILSTFLVLMFGIALSLPTVGDEDPEHGLFGRLRRSPQGFDTAPDIGISNSFASVDRQVILQPACNYVQRCYTIKGKEQCVWLCA